MEKDRLNRKEFFALPVKERRKLLSKQANNPALISYYKAMYRPEPSDMPMDGHATMIEPKPKQDKIEEVKEIVLEIRQYLCSTEFAPEPFTKPVDVKVLTEDFPSKICQLFELKPDQWICQTCEFRDKDNHCICPEMYKNAGNLKPPIVFINCSKSFTECGHYESGLSRLLTDYEAGEIAKTFPEGITGRVFLVVAKAQRDLTASIMDKLCADEKAEFGLSVNEAAVALCEARIEALIEEIWNNMPLSYGKLQALKATHTSKESASELFRMGTEIENDLKAIRKRRGMK